MRKIAPALIAGLLIATLGVVTPAAGLIKPEPPATAHPYITSVTGTPALGMTVAWSDGDVWYTLTRSEYRTTCREVTGRARARCYGNAEADFFWMKQMKRSLRHTRPKHTSAPIRFTAAEQRSTP